MIHVGVDIAKLAHWMAAIDDQGVVMLKPVRITQDAEGYRLLANTLRSLGEPDAMVIGLEATGHYWMLMAEEMTRLGYQVRVFNPILSGSATRMTVRGRKSDADDALLIAKVVRDGNFVAMPLPSTEQLRAKQLSRYRQKTVARSANAKKRMQKCLDLVFPEFTTLFSDECCVSALALLSIMPSARLMKDAKSNALAKTLVKCSRGHLNGERIQDIITSAKASIAATRVDEATEMAIRMTVAEITLLQEQIDAYDKELGALNIPGKELLESIPGIGPVLAVVILAEIVTIQRFTTADPRRQLRNRSRGRNGFHRLLAFAGLDARVCESGEWRGTRRMSKRGSVYLRTALYRAAFKAKNHESFKAIWEHHKVYMKQPGKVASSHIARKVLQAVYGVLSRNVPFDPVAFKGVA
jgi:transposase